MTASFSLPRSTPEEHGVKSEGLMSFLHALEANAIEFHSFMLVRNGNVISEGWWSPYQKDLPHMLFSLSKSFTSTAIGFAVNEGLISVDDPVMNYCREDIKPSLDDAFKKLKIKHLLTMSTGHKEEPILTLGYDKEWENIFFDVPLTYEPGTHFLYNTAATYILSVIITRVTGQTVRDYLMPRLFEPLGIENPVWDLCPQGYSTGGWGLNLKTEDIAKFGLLYLQDGLFNGKRILPEGWVREATSKQIHNGDSPESDWNQGYGYQFWRCRHNAYRGDGAFGQYCLVLPEKNAVLAITSAVPNMQTVLDLVYEHLLPAMTEDSLPSSPSVEALHDKVSRLRLDPPKVQSHSALEAQLTEDRVYHLDENPMGLQRLTFSFDHDKLTLHLDGVEGSICIRAGRESWEPFITMPLEFTGTSRKTFKALGSFTWKNDETLVVTLRLYETPHYMTSTFILSSQELSILSRVNVSFEADPTFKLRATSTK